MEDIGMSGIKNRFCKLSPAFLQATGLLLLILLAALLLWFNRITSWQAFGSISAQIRFEGEYCIDEGPWQPITEGQHIPTSKGDVTLRGNFHMLTPDGEYVGIYSGDAPVAFYLNHICLTVCE